MRILIETSVAMSHLDNEGVLLNLKTGKYFSLNETGVKMWDLLKLHQDTDLVLNAILNEYNAEPDILKQDLNNLVQQLLAEGLVNSN
jgi:hypothetical protein